MGLHASDTSAFVLEDARVGADAVLGEVGKGFGIALAGLDGGRIGIAAQSIGIARAVIERAIAYARERQQFGRPIVEFEAIRFALARARTDLDAARLLALRAAWLRDRGSPFTREASMAKLFASEAAQRVTYQALQVFGGYGYMREYEVERYARDARATTIYEGTSEVQRMVIARSLVAGMTLQKNKTAKQRWLDESYGPAVKKRAERKERFTTLSEVPIDPLYTADDLEGFDPAQAARRARASSRTRAASSRRCTAVAPLDDAPVRGLRLGRGHQRALPLPARARRDRALHRLRHADADGLRLRRSAARAARSVARALPSTRSATWRSSSTRSRSTRSRRR